MRCAWIALLACLVASCADRGDLSERHARATAEALIAANRARIRDFHQLAWQRLERVSPTEARGTATMVYRYRLPNGQMGEERIPGTFVYKKTDQGWALEAVSFPNTNNLYHRLDEHVFVKVTDASVPAGALEGQLFASDSAAADRARTARGEPGRAGHDTPAGALAAAPPSTESARRTAIDYLANVAPAEGAWSAGDFRPLRTLESNELELPATLLVETEQDTTDYRGGFVFDWDAENGRWVLSRLSFRATGVEPIEEALATPVPVD